MVRRSLVIAVLLGLALSSLTAQADPTFYGYIKLDASFDSALTNNGDFAYIVLPFAEGEEHSEFNMTANQTRLGVKFQGPGRPGLETSGRIEFDFYGGGGENKANPMLRHAYLEMAFDGFTVLAGQTSDVISPVVPTTLNYIVLWKSGDVGYRRPQVRVTTDFDVADRTNMEIALAATRSMGRGYDGEASGMPSFQGRLALSTKLLGEKPMTIGVGGVWGQEESTVTDSLGSEVYDLEQSGIAIDAVVPVGDAVTLKGGYFTGKNLSQYLGGIGQGIADVPVEGEDGHEPVEIEASGWWAQLSLQASENFSINVGAGSDDPEIPEDDTTNTLEKNTTYYGNVMWTAAPSTVVGVEYARFETEYVGGESYENNRVQLSFTYKF